MLLELINSLQQLLIFRVFAYYLFDIIFNSSFILSTLILAHYCDELARFHERLLCFEELLIRIL